MADWVCSFHCAVNIYHPDSTVCQSRHRQTLGGILVRKLRPVFRGLGRLYILHRTPASCVHVQRAWDDLLNGGRMREPSSESSHCDQPLRSSRRLLRVLFHHPDLRYDATLSRRYQCSSWSGLAIHLCEGHGLTRRRIGTDVLRTGHHRLLLNQHHYLCVSLYVGICSYVTRHIDLLRKY